MALILFLQCVVDSVVTIRRWVSRRGPNEDIAA